MKRYILFSYNEWYPSGGMADFKGSFDTLSEAEKYHFEQAEQNKSDYFEWKYQIFDVVDHRIVKTNERRYTILNVLS